MPSEPSALQQEVHRVITALCACWERVDLKSIADLWDAGETEPYLLPQELERPLIGWAALHEYLRKAEARLEAASMRVGELNVKLAAPDLAVALYEMHWNGKIAGMVRPMGVDTRVTALFRRRQDAWRICHYVEAPVSFALQLQQRYLDGVDPDFLARVGWEGRTKTRFWPDGSPL